MRQVTLGDEEVEWIDHRDDEHNEVKELLHDDEGMAAWVEAHGTVEALWIIQRFHRVVANQLIVRGVIDPDVSEWARRTIGLCNAIKYHRRHLRGRLKAELGAEALREFLADFDAAHPRAQFPVAA